jgi:hypothetical protein
MLFSSAGATTTSGKGRDVTVSGRFGPDTRVAMCGFHVHLNFIVPKLLWQA